MRFSSTKIEAYAGAIEALIVVGIVLWTLVGASCGGVVGYGVGRSGGAVLTATLGVAVGAGLGWFVGWVASLLTRLLVQSALAVAETADESRRIRSAIDSLVRGQKQLIAASNHLVAAAAPPPHGSSHIPAASLRAGLRVHHPVFGDGSVVSSEGELVRVRFADGDRNLGIAHAPLTIA